MANKIKLSIIIVNWNTKELLKNCLESISQGLKLNAEGKKLNTEIIVVDNNSTDGSREYLKKMTNGRWLKTKEEKKDQSSIINHQSLKVIFNDQNFGFAKANNQGMEIVQGEYVMLLNSDTTVPDKSLSLLVDYLDKNLDTAAVSPQLLNPDKTRQIDYYMKFPNLWQIMLYHNYPLRRISMISPLKFLFASKPKNEPFEVSQLPGAALMIRKKIIDQIGMFDDSFVFFFEDADWCYRIKNKTNLKMIVCPQSKIIHIGGASWKSWLEKSRFKFYRQYYLSLLKFVNKNYSVPIIFYKMGLSFSFLINLISHLITFSRDKAKVQLRLIKSVWTEEPSFQLPQ